MGGIRQVRLRFPATPVEVDRSGPVGREGESVNHFDSSRTVLARVPVALHLDPYFTGKIHQKVFAVAQFTGGAEAARPKARRANFISPA